MAALEESLAAVRGEPLATGADEDGGAKKPRKRSTAKKSGSRSKTSQSKSRSRSKAKAAK